MTNKMSFLIIGFFAIFLNAFGQNKSNSFMEKEINSNWTFKELNGEIFGSAVVPGTIHTDLINNKFIEDPFYRLNEKKLQWIDKKDWEYNTILNITKEEFDKNNIVLDFEGLDTYADVYLNDSIILRADNMFRSWEIDIKAIAKLGKNSLKVILHSPIKKGLELLAASPYPYPAINDQSENGELGDKKVSIFTRKAGYHYGWDWGPRLVTSGIWKPIKLKSWNDVNIKDVFIKQTNVTKEVAQLNFEMEIALNKHFSGLIKIVNTENGSVYASSEFNLEAGIGKISIPVTIKNPELWWSQGLGDPNMYNFSIKIFDANNNENAKKDLSTGLRSLKLVREKDSIGESFLFQLNGVPVFIKGSNYIPNDSFLPRVTLEDYKKVIKDAVDANMNMLRVWGGGIYENDDFYKLCDENGIMVWQDFMFACSMYPGNEEFLNNIKQEAIDNVVRLRNHPSIAVWCGNNEMNTAWHNYSEGGWGWKETYTLEQRNEIQATYLKIFHTILPNVIENYTDGDDYWPSSPQAGFEPEKHAGYENKGGDMHYWGVWHGKHPFEDFEKYKARFMSEYGFQSFPDLETVKKYTLPVDYNIESEVMTSHQRSGIGNLRIKEYMGWDYQVPTDFKSFLYMSQVLQARGVTMAIEAHRRAMPYCMGTMYWQINDCWPVASWSSTDYYHKWKALHYAVKKAYEPIIVTVLKKEDQIIVNAVSDKLVGFSAKLKLTILNFSGDVMSTREIDVKVNQNTSTEIFKVKEFDLLKNFNQNEIVLKVELLNKRKLLSNNLYYFEKIKELKFREPKITTKIVQKKGKKYLQVSTDTLVKNLYINYPNQSLFLEDNYFDLLPNEVKQIEIIGESKMDLLKPELMYILNK
jgi:beta-mannosidase